MLGDLSALSEPMKRWIEDQAQAFDHKKRAIEQEEEGRKLAALIQQEQAEAIGIELQKEADKKEAAEDDLKALRDRLKTEEQVVVGQFQIDIKLLQQQHEDELIEWEDFLTLRNALIKEFDSDRKSIEQKNMTELEKFTIMSRKNQTDFLVGSLIEMTAGVSQYSREMFEINKIAGIANIALKAPEAIANSYAFGTKFGGPVLGALMAGIAATAMAIQATAIAGQTFGGSGAAPSLAGSTSATPVTPVGGSQEQSGGQTTIVNFTGSTSSRDRKLIKEFAELLNENTHNGSTVIIR